LLGDDDLEHDEEDEELESSESSLSSFQSDEFFLAKGS
jgi:hypothetical protein